MRLSAFAQRNTKRLLPLLSAALMLAVLAGPAAAQAVAAPTTTGPSAAAPATTAPSTVTQEATTSSTDGGVTAVVPPAAGLTPLNPDWKTDQMMVQVWPEYDQNAVLVFMNFSLPAEVQLPATFKFAMPTGAWIAGIAEVDPSGNFKYNYADSYPPVQTGAQWDIVTIQVTDFRALQIDYYYDPGLPAGAGARSFPLLAQLPLDVGTLLLHVQQPARATDFTVQPALQGSGQADDGFTYAVGTFSDVKAGSTLGQVVSYAKPDGALSAGTGQTGSTQAGDSAAAKVNTNTVLLAAILVIVVIIGGFIVYRLYANSAKANKSAGRPRPQRSPAAKPAAARPATAAKPKPAANPKNDAAQDAASDKGTEINSQCVACGEELTKKNRFCPNCGEARED
jgi:hypothetical protein